MCFVRVVCECMPTNIPLFKFVQTILRGASQNKPPDSDQPTEWMRKFTEKLKTIGWLWSQTVIIKKYLCTQYTCGRGIVGWEGDGGAEENEEQIDLYATRTIRWTFERETCVSQFCVFFADFWPREWKNFLVLRMLCEFFPIWKCKACKNFSILSKAKGGERGR